MDIDNSELYVSTVVDLRKIRFGGESNIRRRKSYRL